VKKMFKVLAIVASVGLFAFMAGRVAGKSPDQPHMRAALESLRAARHHLDEAEADKGGHRAAAIRATDQAIKHTEEGIRYAEGHK
jgi:hypothetical protein